MDSSEIEMLYSFVFIQIDFGIWMQKQKVIWILWM